MSERKRPTILSFPTHEEAQAFEDLVKRAGDAGGIGLGSITRRDLFVGFALMGLLARQGPDVELEITLWKSGEKDRRFERLAELAGAIADAQVRERSPR